MSAPGMDIQQSMIQANMARNAEGGGVGGGMFMQSFLRLMTVFGGDGQEMGMMRSQQDIGQGMALQNLKLFAIGERGIAAMLRNSGMTQHGFSDIPESGGGGDDGAGESGGSRAMAFTGLPSADLGDFGNVPPQSMGSFIPSPTPRVAGMAQEISVGG